MAWPKPAPTKCRPRMHAPAAIRHLTQAERARAIRDNTRIQISEPEDDGAGQPEVGLDPGPARATGLDRVEQQARDPGDQGQQHEQDGDLAGHVLGPGERAAQIQGQSAVGQIRGDQARPHKRRQQQGQDPLDHAEDVEERPVDGRQGVGLETQHGEGGTIVGQVDQRGTAQGVEEAQRQKQDQGPGLEEPGIGVPHQDQKAGPRGGPPAFIVLVGLLVYGHIRLPSP